MKSLGNGGAEQDMTAAASMGHVQLLRAGEASLDIAGLPCDNGADIDYEASLDIAGLPLDNGADIDYCDEISNGKTAFHLSDPEGHDNVDGIDGEGRTVVSVLLDRGLDEQHRDNAGWGHLHYAAFEGHSIIVNRAGHDRLQW